MPFGRYGIVLVFALATVGVAVLTAVWVETTTAPEFIRNYSIRVVLTILAVGGVAVILRKYRE